MWRSATTQKQIKGYSDMVLNHHRERQPNLPPTTLIVKDSYSTGMGSTNNNKSSTGFNTSNTTLMGAGKKQH
jgi:hypothetical protein